MDYIEFKVWKLVALAVLAFGWGLYCGLTGRPLVPGRRDNQTALGQDQERR